MRTLFKLGRYLMPLPIVMSALVAALLFSGVQAAPTAAQAVTHPNTHSLHKHEQAHSTSDNWSGYATTGNIYHDVRGSWTVPAVRCAARQTAYSSFWVGLDGDVTSTVEQIGTDADCLDGRATYYAWYEMYPKISVTFPNTVRAGDHLNAEVSFNSSGQFVLDISDTTRGWRHHVVQTLSNAQRRSAEWVAEAPAGANGTLPMANFGTVGFTNCTANGVAIGSNPNVDPITMVSKGVTKARPSGLSGGGTSFTVTWRHN